MAVTLYRQVGKGKASRYQKLNLGRGRRQADLKGPYSLRYSLADGSRPWEAVASEHRSPSRGTMAIKNRQSGCRIPEGRKPSGRGVELSAGGARPLRRCSRLCPQR